MHQAFGVMARQAVPFHVYVLDHDIWNQAVELRAVGENRLAPLLCVLL